MAKSVDAGDLKSPGRKACGFDSRPAHQLEGIVRLSLEEFKEISEENELLLMDGYDDCVVGLVERFGQPTIICYDRDKVLEKLVRDGMTEEEAEEWFNFNQLGAWMGDKTPCFLSAIAG